MIHHLGDKIKKHRKEKGLTLDGLAKKVSISRSYLSGLEHKSLPNTNLITRIAKAIGVTVEYLLDDSIEAFSEAEKEVLTKLKRLKHDEQKKISQIIELWQPKINKNN